MKCPFLVSFFPSFPSRNKLVGQVRPRIPLRAKMPSIMTAWTPRLGKLGYLGCVEMRYIQGVLHTEISQSLFSVIES
jgi:hypothetical protein